MSRTPQINLSRSSFVKLPKIEQKAKSKDVLEDFGMKRRSISKAAIFENHRKKMNASPSKNQ